MILTVTLNPAIDIRYNFDNLEKNKINRVENGNRTPGGKGLNVSRVIKRLGGDIIATGFLGGNNGKWIEGILTLKGIENKFYPIMDETRVCLALIDKNGQTEILERGPKISEKEQNYFLDNLEKNLSHIEIVCCSGSLPDGLEKNFYNKILKICNKKNIKVILDTSGVSLEKSLKEKPYLIKPNLEELENILKKRLYSDFEIIVACKKLKKFGAENILVTLGENGGIFVGEEIYKIEIPKFENVKNSVGSGDSTIAGIAFSLSRKKTLKDSLRYGIACGISNALSYETGDVDINFIEKIVENIKIVEMDA